MIELLFLMLKQQHKKRKELPTLDTKKNTVALIGVNL